LLLPALIFAQSNYKPGYVVTLKGDTTTRRNKPERMVWKSPAIDFRNPAASKTFTVDDIAFLRLITHQVTNDMQVL
jgi:hypothetical protein